MKYEFRQMLAQSGAVIVNTASVSGQPGLTSRQARRQRADKTAALEYAQSGIRMNAVCSGVIRTPVSNREAISGLNAAVSIAVAMKTTMPPIDDS